MWALNTPPASVRLFTDLPLAHFEDVRERTGNELGHTFSAFSCFFCLASFSRLLLSLTCPDPSAPSQGFFFFSLPHSISPPFLSAQAVSGSLNVYIGERAPALVLITALSQRCAPFTQGRDSIRMSDITFIQHTCLHQSPKIALSALKSHIIVYILFPHISVLNV